MITLHYTCYDVLLSPLIDAGLELRDGGADVRQLDDVGLAFLAELAQGGEVVGHALVLLEELRELGDDARGHGDVLEGDADEGLGLCFDSRSDCFDNLIVTCSRIPFGGRRRIREDRP